MFNRFRFLIILVCSCSAVAAQETVPADTLTQQQTPIDSLAPRNTPVDSLAFKVNQPNPIITLLSGVADEIALEAEGFDAATAVASRDTIKVEKEKIRYWKELNKVGLNLNEVAFVNWSSGGNNSFSALLHMTFGRTYKKKLLNWSNNANIKYGINAQEGRKIRKSEDQLEINSNFGYRKDSVSNWYYSAKLNFNTQFTYGFRYPNTDEPISKFMAPGYAFVGVGTEFSHPTEDFTAYISPVTEKSTFVLDQRMANEGRFGVAPAIRDEEGNILQEGEKIRTEFGFLVSSSFSKEIFDNIGLSNQVRLYSDYLNKFGNVDVDWELNVNLKVNQYVQANVGSHIKYDDDVKIQIDDNDDGILETNGPRLQFKQLLGVGLVYQF